MSQDGLAVNIRVHLVSSLHFCSRHPLSQALSPTLSYVSTFPLNVYSSSGRSQGNECHLYLWMSPPGLGRSQVRQEGPCISRGAGFAHPPLRALLSSRRCMHTRRSHIGTTPHVWQVQSGLLHQNASVPQLLTPPCITSDSPASCITSRK